MKILIAMIIMLFSLSVYAQDQLTQNEISMLQQIIGVENKTCSPVGGGCRTFEDCCRGYCDGTHRCNNGGGNGACTPDGVHCATSQECCSNFCDNTGICR